MKIAVPVETNEGLKSIVAGHFGHAPYYAFVEGKTRHCVIVPNASSHNGGDKLPPEWLFDEGVNVLICNGLGARAIGLCTQLGIEVYITEEQTVGESLGAFEAGTLTRAGSEDACAHEH